MRKCPKCQLTYGDDAARICRACGAILDEVASVPAQLDAWLSEPAAPEQPAAARDDRFDEAVLPVDLADAVAELPPPAVQEWICTTCGERVPASFDFCWNCENSDELATEKSAPPAPVEAPTVVTPIARAAPAASATRLATPCCPKCQSMQIMSGVTVLDAGQSSWGKLSVVVYGNPDALLFKEALYGEIVADVCGECGHVELRVLNPGELYQRSLRSPP